MALTKYLHPRPGSPNLYVRLSVPTDIQDALGKIEITKSMGTSDRRLAEQRAMKFISAQKERFDNLSAGDEAVAPADINEKIVETYYDKFLGELHQRSKLYASQGVDQLEGWLGKLKFQQSEWKRRSIAEDYDRATVLLEAFIDKQGFKFGGEIAHLLPSIMTAIIETFNVTIKRLEGDNEAAPTSQFVQLVNQHRNNRAKEGERLSNFKVKYLSELILEENRKPANVEQYGMIIDLFIEWVGDDYKVSSLTKKHSSSFREVLDAFPASRMKTKRLASASVAECIKIAERDSLRLLSQSSKGKYVSQLSGFFRWLVKRGICVSNIWNGMNYKPDKAAKQRPPFTVSQLNQILRSPLYSGFLKDGKEHLFGDLRANDWRFWIPLLCMFTGSRITEIAQLHVDEIEEREGCLVGYLRHDIAKGQSLKSETSKRFVVFNSNLIAAGFDDYWRKQAQRSKRDGNERLFPELTAGKRPELGQTPSRFWREYLEKIGVKKKGARDGFGSHSFRHLLADEMRIAGYLDIEFGQIVMGHSNNSMTGRYGIIPQGTVERLRTMIEAVQFKGVDFSTVIKN